MDKGLTWPPCPHPQPHKATTLDPDHVDLGVGMQLAHHEDGCDRLSTPHLSQFVYVDWASASRPSVVFSESSVSDSTHVLA
jgi:hypothetical protein